MWNEQKIRRAVYSADLRALLMFINLELHCNAP